MCGTFLANKVGEFSSSPVYAKMSVKNPSCPLVSPSPQYLGGVSMRVQHWIYQNKKAKQPKKSMGVRLETKKHGEGPTGGVSSATTDSGLAQSIAGPSLSLLGCTAGSGNVFSLPFADLGSSCSVPVLSAASLIGFRIDNRSVA